MHSVRVTIFFLAFAASAQAASVSLSSGGCGLSVPGMGGFTLGYPQLQSDGKATAKLIDVKAEKGRAASTSFSRRRSRPSRICSKAT